MVLPPCWTLAPGAKSMAALPPSLLISALESSGITTVAPSPTVTAGAPVVLLMLPSSTVKVASPVTLIAGAPSTDIVGGVWESVSCVILRFTSPPLEEMTGTLLSLDVLLMVPDPKFRVPPLF